MVYGLGFTTVSLDLHWSAVGKLCLSASGPCFGNPTMCDNPLNGKQTKQILIDDFTSRPIRHSDFLWTLFAIVGMSLCANGIQCFNANGFRLDIKIEFAESDVFFQSETHHLVKQIQVNWGNTRSKLGASNIFSWILGWLEPQKDQLMSSSSLNVLLCISSHILGDVYKKTKVLWKFMKGWFEGTSARNHG